LTLLIVLPIESMINIYIMLYVIPITMSSTSPIPTDDADFLTVGETALTAESPSGFAEDRIIVPVMVNYSAQTDSLDPPPQTNGFPIVSARCSALEALVWKDNNDFSLALSGIARLNFGSGPSTAADLLNKYKDLSLECASCFGDNVACGVARCFIHCMFSSFSAACLDCTDRECNPALKACLGVEDAGMPPRPSTEAESLTSTSTKAPRKRPVRRPVEDTTTMAPLEETTDVSVQQNATAPSTLEDIPNTLLNRLPRFWYVYVSGLVGLLAIAMSRLNGTGTSFQ
jgi:hypothetical protein